MDAETLSITLPADMAQTIRAAVSTGAYASDSEVIREAMRLWQERHADREQRLSVIRTRIQDAIDDPVRVTAEDMRAHFERLTTEAEKRGGS
ncbi:MAG: type II toxin-antitoxin system ParD family antitoxin [Acetobacteraceae bacterium]|nr:type II toxin-antitoxin system ParD family antitoxin [Acetobacteraceae bacterium]